MSRKLSGKNRALSTVTGPETFSAKLSAASFARLFGVISPKISTTTVITTVETVAPLLLKKPTNSTVAMLAEEMFTMLLPISTVASRRS